MTVVTQPFPTFHDASGNPLEAGFIYIGQAGFEARSMPKASFFDAAMTIPTGTASGAAIRTMGGFPVRNSSPAVFFVAGNYSITVTDRNGVVQYSSLNSSTSSVPLTVDVSNFGAVGNGSTSDHAAFVSALASTTGPVFVPWTPNYYVLTSLSESDRRRLYGPGEVRVGGVKTFISDTPWVRDTDGHVRVFNHAWQPSKWATVEGSLYNGAVAVDMTRTGGFGSYGMFMANLTVTDATPAGEFDVASAAFVTSQNLTNGSGFAGWWAAIGPSAALGHVFTGGSVIGGEINYGNRWGSQGLTVEAVNTRNHVGLKIVPDVGPSKDGPAFEPVTSITIASPGVITRNAHGYYNGLRLRIYARTGTLPGGLTEGAQYFVVNATTNTFQLSATFGGAAINTTGTFAAGVAVLPSYPGDFGLVIGRSIWWHQTWTGMVINSDTVVPGGVSMRVRGGSSVAQGPGNAYVLDGFFTTGINTSLGTFVNDNALFLGAGQNLRWAGDARMNSTAGALGITTGNADSDGALYANNFGVAAFVWDGTGGAARIKFYDAVAPVAKQTVTGSKGGNAALADLITKLAATGIITDATT